MAINQLYTIPELDLLWTLAKQGNVAEAKELYLRISDNPYCGSVLRRLLLLGEFDAAETLLKAGIPVDIKVGNLGEVTTLWHASALGRTDIVRFLLQHGADPYIPIGNTTGRPIDIARSWGHTDIVRLLAERMSELVESRRGSDSG